MKLLERLFYTKKIILYSDTCGVKAMHVFPNILISIFYKAICVWFNILTILKVHLCLTYISTIFVRLYTFVFVPPFWIVTCFACSARPPIFYCYLSGVKCGTAEDVFTIQNGGALENLQLLKMGKKAFWMSDKLIRTTFLNFSMKSVSAEFKTHNFWAEKLSNMLL